MSHTLQGKFRPRNPEKYKGNVGDIFYRSSWEKNFMEWCDKNEAVLLWQSEEKRIRYYDPVKKRNRTYYPDFLVKYINKDGRVLTEMVEVKPIRQVKGPNPNPKKRTKSWMNQVNTYITNQCKWKAAEEYCQDQGWTFRLLTEQNISKWQLL